MPADNVPRKTETIYRHKKGECLGVKRKDRIGQDVAKLFGARQLTRLINEGQEGDASSDLPDDGLDLVGDFLLALLAARSKER